jgi:hypothetical protein
MSVERSCADVSLIASMASVFERTLRKFMKTAWVIADLIFDCFAGISGGRNV